ncbi:MAG: tetratricopeptide repeat protein [bacterium]
MENLGLNNDIMVGGRKFHVQTNYSSSKEKVIANVFNEGQVIDSREISIEGDLSSEEISNRLNEIHQSVITDMEILYYMAAKVKTVRHAPSANKLGLLFLKKNLIKEALEQFKLALEIDPEFSEVFANLGKAFIISDCYDEAIEVLEKGLVKAPEFADIQNYLGIAYLQKDNIKEAIFHLNEALKLNPNYVEAHYHLGIAFLIDSLNQSDEHDPSIEVNRKNAAEHLNQAAEMNLNDHIPNFYKLIELVSQEAFQEAVDEYKKGKPGDMLANFLDFENEFYLKFMYGGKGKDDSFISDYVQNLHKIIEEFPHYADLRNNLGIAYLIQCRNLFLKSLDEFRSALNINPNYKKAEKNLKLAENDGKGFLILLRAILK